MSGFISLQWIAGAETEVSLVPRRIVPVVTSSVDEVGWRTPKRGVRPEARRDVDAVEDLGSASLVRRDRSHVKLHLDRGPRPDCLRTGRRPCEGCGDGSKRFRASCRTSEPVSRSRRTFTCTSPSGGWCGRVGTIPPGSRGMNSCRRDVSAALHCSAVSVLVCSAAMKGSPRERLSGDDESGAHGPPGSIEVGDGVISSEVYNELRLIAARHLSRERGNRSIDPTELVHEAWVKLSRPEGNPWRGREHFLALASSLMRRILVDHARRRRRLKRGGDHHRVTVSSSFFLPEDRGAVDLEALDIALQRLARHDEQDAKAIVMQYFGGMKVEEIAMQLELPPRTMQDRLMHARAWLERELRRLVAESLSGPKGSVAVTPLPEGEFSWKLPGTATARNEARPSSRSPSRARAHAPSVCAHSMSQANSQREP